ncbi:sulfotransferase domain-containing protein [Winogradskyella sp.]|uniref:sulfotransferase domain-containing protein n=1 Tax=Winogradskyella sp. TaxID=1883156 RepID=UPI002610495D|nr:sulfotransferase domain-containing protein [Winogradskyella sp.]
MVQTINTFLVGAQKAGTTSLYDWLGQHPEVLAPEEIKDYHFFTNENFFKKGIKHLESFYKKETPIKLHGAVNYMYFHQTASQRIYKYNNDIRIIVCLRNPVNRAVSAYNYFKRTLREEKTFEQAINAELNGELTTFVQQSNNTYVQHGYYARQVQSFLKKFGKKNCHFVLFEELIDTRMQQEVMQQVCQFLGIDDDFQFSFVHLNASAQPRSKTINFIIRKSGLTKVLKPLLPLRYRKKLGKTLEQKNIGEKKINTTIEKDTIKSLKEKFLPRVEALSDVVGRDLVKFWNFRNKI